MVWINPDRCTDRQAHAHKHIPRIAIVTTMSCSLQMSLIKTRSYSQASANEPCEIDHII